MKKLSFFNFGYMWKISYDMDVTVSFGDEHNMYHKEEKIARENLN